jgi:transcription termination factor 2
MGIKWQDLVTSEEVLKRAGLPRVAVLLRERRLRWGGHVARMDQFATVVGTKRVVERIPYQLLFGELDTRDAGGGMVGNRDAGGQRQRWRDTFRSDLYLFAGGGVSKKVERVAGRGGNDKWFVLAQDREQWRAIVREGAEVHDARRGEQRERKRAVRKDWEARTGRNAGGRGGARRDAPVVADAPVVSDARRRSAGAPGGTLVGDGTMVAGVRGPITILRRSARLAVGELVFRARDDSERREFSHDIT